MFMLCNYVCNNEVIFIINLAFRTLEPHKNYIKLIEKYSLISFDNKNKIKCINNN